MTPSRWLCGGVGVNYHSLADFRAAHGALLERLLSENVAALSAAGVISLDEVARDGMRVRAWAGLASFRRRKTLAKELKKAKRLMTRLKGELDDDPGAGERRVAAARGKLGEIEAERARNWGLQRFTPRGRDKATTQLNWFALANNILAGHRRARQTA